MKYICLGYYDKSKFDGMTESERNAMFDVCFDYDDHLRANGHWAGGEALQGTETALTLSWKNGKVVTTDGPYAETKEQLGGILVLEARDMNHAVQLMGQHPAVTYGNIFEIRPAADLSEMTKASEQRDERITPDEDALPASLYRCLWPKVLRPSLLKLRHEVPEPTTGWGKCATNLRGFSQIDLTWASPPPEIFRVFLRFSSSSPRPEDCSSIGWRF
jgi:hypothetical protein